MQTLLTTISLFELLKNTSSKNAKQDILKEHSDNKFFLECLKFLLDPQITTGISRKKYNRVITTISETHPEPLSKEFLDMLNHVKTYNTGKDITIQDCKIWANNLPESIQDFTAGMITKSIKLGIDYKTVNAAIPDLIPTYETQQAYPLSDKNMPKPNEWFSLSEKINGTNCGILNAQCISRQGKPFANMDHIINEINQLGLSDMYVNGELVRINYNNIPDDENFQKSVSIINSKELTDKTEIGFVFYEALTLNEFNAGQSNQTYKDRLAAYQVINQRIKNLNLKYIKFINHFYAGTDQAEIQKWLDYADSHNMEGCMLNKDTYWLNKRNNGILKVKSFLHCDILCKAVEEGNSKYANTLGAIVCDYKGFDLHVGSGFTDAQRNDFWNHPETIIGKIVTVKYKTETKNKNGGISVQFPTFCVIRDDKTEPSYY